MTMEESIKLHLEVVSTTQNSDYLLAGVMIHPDEISSEKILAFN